MIFIFNNRKRLDNVGHKSGVALNGAGMAIWEACYHYKGIADNTLSAHQWHTVGPTASH